MNKLFSLEVLTYDKKYLDTQISSLIIPAYDGLLGIKKGHTKAICLMKPGIIEIEDDKQQKKKYAIGEGICTITPNKVILLVRSFEAEEDIDKNRLKESSAKILEKTKKIDSYSSKEQKKIINSILRNKARQKLISQVP